jgi:hypothetical protein
MENKKERVWVISLAALLLAGVLMFVILKISENIVENKLLEIVNSELEPNSYIEFDNLKLRIFPIRIVLDDVRLVHNQPFAEQTVQQPSDAIRKFELKKAELSGLSLIPMIRGNEWELGTLTLDSLIVELVPTTIDSPVKSTPLKEPVPVTISDIHINNSSISTYKNRDSEIAEWQIDGANLNLENFLAGDPDAAIHTYFEHFRVNADKITHRTNDGFYEMTADSIRLNSRDQNFTLTALQITPLKTPYEIASEVGHAIDVFEIQSGEIQFSDFDVNEWITNDNIFGEKVTLSHFKMYVRRDRTYARKPSDDRPLPHAAFAELPFEVQIDTIALNNGEVVYSEEFIEEDRKGAVSFENINLTITSLQNKLADNIIDVTATTRFLGEADLDLEFEFYPNVSGRHTIKAQLSELDLKVMNNTLENLAFVRFNDGHLNSLEFSIYAGEYTSAGDLVMTYENLGLRLLDNETLTEGNTEKILSFLANTLAIRSNNTGEDPRVGEISFEREKDRSMFNYWWSTIQSGLMDTIKR